MDRLGLDMLTAFGLPPVEYVNLAADLGCGHITTGLTALPWNPCHFPKWSLREDAALRRDMIATLRARGVTLSVVSGFSLQAQVEMRDLGPEMDLAAELGARQLATVGMDPDIPRAHDQFATLTEMATERGLQVVLDYAPHQKINTLDMALATLRHAQSSNALLSIDAMHFFRAGGTAAILATVDPAVIGYVQVCDVPTVAPHPDYGREALFERLVPGDGELPLADFVKALPKEVLIGVEVPNVAAVDEGRKLKSFITRAVAASRKLLQ